MNPLDLAGFAFLELFFVAWLAVAGVLLVLRAWLARGSGRLSTADQLAAELADGTRPTSVAAYVSGGIECAIEAAVAGLHHGGALHVRDATLVPDPPEPVLQPDGTYRGVVVAPTPERMPAEAYVMAELENGPQTVGELIRHAHELDGELRSQTLADGLVVPEVARTGVMLSAILLGVAWAALGIAKIDVGAARNHPVGVLIMLLLAGIVPLALLARAPRVTRKGQEVLRLLRDRTGALTVTATRAPEQIDGRRFALAYALAGAELVGAAELLELMPSYQRKLAQALRASGT